MPDPRIRLHALYDALDEQLDAFFKPLAAALRQGVTRAADTSGLIPERRLPFLRDLVERLVVQVFGTAPGAQFDGAGVPQTPFARFLTAGIRAGTLLAVDDLLAEIRDRLERRPDLLLPLLQGRPAAELKAPIFDPARTWVDPNGYRLSDRIWRNGQEVRAQIDALLDYHILAGSDAVTIGAQLERFLTVAGRTVTTETPYLPPYGVRGLAWPRNLARTETARAYGAATIEAARLNPFTRAVGWRLSAMHPHQDVCDHYASADPHGLGRGNYRPDDPPAFPGHPSCFPAGTHVTGPPVDASTQRWYSGDVVEITTARGHVLTVTPNHPILTPQGWVAAGQLHEGGDVLSCLDPQRMASLVNPDNEYVETLIEEVAITLGGASAVTTSSVPLSAEDFHQDAADSQVGIVRTHRHLRDTDNAEITQPLLEQRFGRGNVQLSRLPSLGVLALALPTSRAATHSTMRRPGVRGALFGSELADAQALRGRPVSWGDTLCEQATSDGHPRDAIRAGQRQFGLTNLVASGDLAIRQLRSTSPSRLPCLPHRHDARRTRVSPQTPSGKGVSQSLPGDLIDARGIVARLAGHVISDRIVQIGRRRFRGHVYNLQTRESWYSANTIIVHNCLCYLTPVTIENVNAVVDGLAAWVQGADVSASLGAVGEHPLEREALTRWLTGITPPGA